MSARSTTFLVPLGVVLVATGVLAADLGALLCTNPGCDGWTATFHGPEGRPSFGERVLVAGDGRTVFAVGDVRIGSGYSDFAVIAYDMATGAERWWARVAGPGGEADYPNGAVLVPGDDTLVVSGVYSVAARNQDWMTVAYDTATGAERWRAPLDGAASMKDVPLAVAASPTEVFVAGYTSGPGSHPSDAQSDATVVAYAVADGSLLWRRDLDSGDDDNVDNLRLSPDGTAVYLLWESLNAEGYRWQIEKLDAATGATLWSWARADVRGYGWETDDLLVSPDGATVYLAGTHSPVDTTMRVFALDADTGAQKWGASWEGLPYDSDAFALALAPDGSRAYVGGRIAGDMLVAAIDPHGQWLWYRTIAGGAGYDDVAVDLATSPSGDVVYVGGNVDSRFFWSCFCSVRNVAVVALLAVDGSAGWADVRTGQSPPDNDRFVSLAVSATDGRVATLVELEGKDGLFDLVTFTLPGRVPSTEPQAATAAAGPGRGEISLAWAPPLWNGAARIESYNVHRAVGELPFERVANVASTSYVDSDLADGTTYRYRIAAVNELGEGALSATVSATTFAAPSAPRSVRAAPGPGVASVVVSWDAPASDGGTAVTGFVVYKRSGESTTATVVATLPSDARGFTDAHASPLTPHRYAVAATNLVGEGPSSTESCTWASPWIPPVGVASASCPPVKVM